MCSSGPCSGLPSENSSTSISWTISVALSPVSPFVKPANETVSGLTSQKYPHECLLLFVTLFSITVFSCPSCHSVCSHSVLEARGGWQPRHHHHLHCTEQETKVRASEWAAWFCMWWSQNLSRDLLNPLLHLFLSLKKHLHSNSIDHDIAVKILYWPVVNLKSPRIFALTRIWTADSLRAGIMAQRQTNYS